MRYLFILFLLAGCSAGVQTVSPGEFAALPDDVFVIDVHIPEQEHIPGTDAVIPYNELEEHRELLPDTNTPVAVYCRSGSMSAEAAQILHDMGYEVYDLEGGRNAYEAWRQQ